MEAALGVTPSAPLTIDAMTSLRASPLVTAAPIGDAGLALREIEVPGAGGYVGTAAVFRRPGDDAVGPGFLFVHGGGMVFGDHLHGVEDLVPWVLRFGGSIVSIDYRLAPEFPAPTPVEDAYAAVSWVVEHSQGLGFDPECMMLIGSSGGGGLVAGVALLARDRHGPPLRGTWLVSPMLDDRNVTASARQFDALGYWTTRSNRVAWSAVLGDAVATDGVSPYDAPARAPWLGGLPSVLITVGSAEPFRDEAVAFASAIWRDGGDCELHVLPGGSHGYWRLARNSNIAEIHNAAAALWAQRLIEPEDPAG